MAAWVWQDAIPSYENSHRLHRCAQIRRQLTQPKNLWKSVKSVGENLAPETSVNSANSVGELAEGGVGMAGCHTLLRKLPQIARMCTD